MFDVTFLSPLSYDSALLNDFLRIIPHDAKITIVDEDASIFAKFQQNLSKLMNFEPRFVKFNPKDVFSCINNTNLLVNCNPDFSIERILQLCITKRINLINAVISSDLDKLELIYSKDVVNSNMFVMLKCLKEDIIMVIGQFYAKSMFSDPTGPIKIKNYTTVNGLLPPFGSIHDLCHSMSQQEYTYLFKMHLLDKRFYQVPYHMRKSVENQVYLRVSKTMTWINVLMLYFFLFLCQFIPKAAILISRYLNRPKMDDKWDFIATVKEEMGEQTISTQMVTKSENYTRIQSLVILLCCKSRDLTPGIHDSSIFQMDLINLLKEYNFVFSMKNSSFLQNEIDRYNNYLSQYVYMQK